MPLDVKFHVELLADYAAALDLASTQSPLRFVKQINLATGVGANQADKLWHDERTINASSNEDLDLAGVLLDPVLGTAMTFVKIKGIFIHANPANTNNVVVGGAAATQFVGPFGAATHTIAVPPNGMLVSYAPGAAGIGTVGAGASDFLRVANSGAGTAVTYQIVIIGTSA